MRFSPANIFNYVRQQEEEHQTFVPRSDAIHVMERLVTHKRQICYKMIVEGETVAETARETNHSPEAITRYVEKIANAFFPVSIGA